MNSFPGLQIRIAIGVGIFISLAAVDLYWHGRQATRWREYVFLFLVTLAAMAYGVANDQITSRISWEYFYYGKELDKIIGPQVPPDAMRLHWEAAKIGIAATWSAGLVLGVILLLANNPWRSIPRLQNRNLLAFLPLILLITVACAVVLGFVGYVGGLNWMSRDFADMTRADIFRPRRFICVYGVHLGGYAGGLIAAMIAAARVIHCRRRNATLQCQV